VVLQALHVNDYRRRGVSASNRIVHTLRGAFFRCMCLIRIETLRAKWLLATVILRLLPVACLIAALVGVMLGSCTAPRAVQWSLLTYLRAHVNMRFECEACSATNQSKSHGNTRQDEI